MVKVKTDEDVAVTGADDTSGASIPCVGYRAKEGTVVVNVP